MRFNYLASAETESGEHEFGATVHGDLADDMRPVFAAARNLAVEQAEAAGYPGDSVTVTEISWTS